MDFLESLIFILVFAIVSIYFWVQFANSIKINQSLLKGNEFGSDVFKKIDGLCKINIISYCVACTLLTGIYFLITKTSVLSVSIISSIPLLIMCLFYIIGVKTIENKNKIKMYKIYNYVNFTINIIILFVPIGFIFTVYGTNLL